MFCIIIRCQNWESDTLHKGQRTTEVLNLVCNCIVYHIFIPRTLFSFICLSNFPYLKSKMRETDKHEGDISHSLIHLSRTHNKPGAGSSIWVSYMSGRYQLSELLPAISQDTYFQDVEIRNKVGLELKQFSMEHGHPKWQVRFWAKHLTLLTAFSYF